MIREILLLISEKSITCLNFSLKGLLFLCGVVDEKYQKFEFPLVVTGLFFYTFNIILLSVNIIIMKIPHYRMQATIQTISLATMLIFGWFLRFRQKSIQHFIAILNELDINEPQLMNQVKTRFIKLMLVVVSWFITIIILNAMTPFYMLPFQGIDYRPLYPTVFFYSCENSLAFFCIRSDTYLKYFFNNVYLFIFASVNVTAHLFLILYCILCYIFLKTYFENLFTQIKLAPAKVKMLVDEKEKELESRWSRLDPLHRRLAKRSWDFKHEFEKLLYAEYVEIIKRYQLFHR